MDYFGVEVAFVDNSTRFCFAIFPLHRHMTSSEDSYSESEGSEVSPAVSKSLNPAIANTVVSSYHSCKGDKGVGQECTHFLLGLEFLILILN